MRERRQKCLTAVSLQAARLRPRQAFRSCLLLLCLVGTLPVRAQSAGSDKSDQAVTAALLSDPHLDPFRDPGKAKRLAVANVAQWAQILSEAKSPNADADFAALQKTCNEKLTDADTSLEVSALGDARSAHPAVVLVAGDMLVHGFACRYRTLLDPSGTDAAGLANFAEKVVEFQLAQMQASFPETPIHLALGNNDSDCEDYSLDEHSPFFDRLTDAVAAGWAGISPPDRTAAKQDFRKFGSYALPLAASVPNTRILVLDDLYLSSDYRGTCGKGPNRASATALLGWIAEKLAEAKRNHQAVWVLAHIPPEVNIYRTYLRPHDICHGEQPDTFLAGDALTALLVQYAETVRIFVAGHTHLDEIHLIGEEAVTHGGAVPLKVVPSLSPVSTNLPSYLLGKIDPKTGDLVDYAKRVATMRAAAAPQWSTAYDFQERYKEPAFTAAAVGDMLHRWQTDPGKADAEIGAYQTSIASGFRLLALRATWPQQLCALQHNSASGFAACSCSAEGGMLPPVQSAK